VIAKIIKNEIILEYSAYSCDSSFYFDDVYKMKTRINFCPLCGSRLLKIKPDAQNVEGVK